MPETGLGIGVFISKRPQFHFCLICKIRSGIKITTAALILKEFHVHREGKEGRKGEKKEGSMGEGERTAP